MHLHATLSQTPHTILAYQIQWSTHTHKKQTKKIKHYIYYSPTLELPQLQQILPFT